MLDKSMSLKNMIQFSPTPDEMFALPLDVIVYIKVSIVSYSKEDNYSFIKYLFTNEEVSEYFKDYPKTTFYDFDGTNTQQERFVTIFELQSLMNFASTSIYLEDLMNSYNHQADVVIDLFTHDNKKYRLSDIDSIVKLDEII